MRGWPAKMRAGTSPPLPAKEEFIMASTGIKVVLVGCAVIGIGFVVAIGVGGYFVKKKVGEKINEVKNMTGAQDSDYGKKTEELKKQYQFSPPSNGIITESQLMRFLAIRKSVYETYKKYEADFKKVSDSEKPGLDAPLKGIKMWNDIHMVQVQELEKQKMSPDEYSYITTGVYKTWFAKGTREAMKHESFSEASADGLKKSIAALDKQIQDPATNEDLKKQLQKIKEGLESQLKSIGENQQIKEMDAQLESVPKENIELFTKHQKEIEQYSMAGLELIGL